VLQEIPLYEPIPIAQLIHNWQTTGGISFAAALPESGHAAGYAGSEHGVAVMWLCDAVAGALVEIIDVGALPGHGEGDRHHAI
jgi:hypothetical protein